MKRHTVGWATYLFASMMLLQVVWPGITTAADRAPWVGRLVSTQGMVEIKSHGKNVWDKASPEDAVFPGDMVRVAKDSRASLVLRDNTLVRLDQFSTIRFPRVEERSSFLMKLIRGAAHFFSRTPKQLKIETPFVNASIEGTEFSLQVRQEQTQISVMEGYVKADNTAGSLTLEKGQSAVAASGQPPVLRLDIKPQDTIHWALYYTPVLSPRHSKTVRELEALWPEAVSLTREKMAGNDVSAAIAALERIPDNGRDANFYALRASLKLGAGRYHGAQEDIDSALKLDSSSGEAAALAAIIALTQNSSDMAMEKALEATARAPMSAAAHLSLSYAHQSQFNLKPALAAARKAAGIEPDNAMILARLAELYLAAGDYREARNKARLAVEKDGQSALAQTVFGFVSLTWINLDDAAAAFRKAIDLDQAAPLPRLGLGLTTIRSGGLKEGRGHIEIAASLAPGKSLLRSYLGKAYYDEKRVRHAEKQFMLAKDLDQNDPTPWYYNAILKLSTNRPVEALKDLQNSIQRNDNRAVYRSRLLLDQDLAARSASMGQIYRDLGFEQQALLEGAKSVNAAPGNYSAHRFLADIYATLPRHEIGRVSELLQSQLLQPLNVTPVQPQLAQTGLFIYEGMGPSEPAFNEYNSLFLRNRVALQANGVVAENDTWGDDVVLSGIWNRVSASAGQFHYQSDGFRDNNDQNQAVYNGFAQVSLAPTTSLQAEYRYADAERGDMELTFTGDYNPELRQEDEVQTMRFGLRHGFNPGSDLLLSFIYQDADLSADVVPGFFSLASDVNYYITEARYLHQADRLYITAGGGYRKMDTTEVTAFQGFPIEDELRTEFSNVYLYGNANFPPSVTWILGASGDFLKSEFANGDKDQFNPKFGLIWHPLQQLTVRGAVFRTLQKPSVSLQSLDPSLEPSQVAGFNQYYLGVEGEDVWHYGLGIDHKFTASLTGGAEFSYRDIETPFVDTFSETPRIIRQDWDERLARAYVYWTPCRFVSAAVEYLYEDFDRETDALFAGTEQFATLRTHRFPLGLNFFHPSGLRAGIQAVYVDQSGDFWINTPTEFALTEGSDQFWVFNASIGYRLPKRFGTISLEAKNLFDEQFQFQDTDPTNPRIVPERTVLLKVSLVF
jgi:tetratricopeptide (TPR) repeat protein